MRKNLVPENFCVFVINTNFKTVSLMQKQDFSKTFPKMVKMALHIPAHRKVVQQ